MIKGLLILKHVGTMKFVSINAKDLNATVSQVITKKMKNVSKTAMKIRKLVKNFQFTPPAVTKVLKIGAQ